MNKEEKTRAEADCLMGGCPFFTGYVNCLKCGFNRYEDTRRKKIPLTVGPDGLRRKYVGNRSED